MGRTEDVCFSPANRRLAIAGFGGHRLYIFDIEIGRATEKTSVSLTGGIELESSALKSPHGVDFIDEDTLIVTNRSGDVCLFRLPAGASHVPVHPGEPEATWPVDGLLQSPGSVCATRVAEGSVEVLICNNTAHTVSRHRVDANGTGPTLRSSSVFLKKWLNIPDGVTRSPDHRWLAVSNHNAHQVFVYDASRPLTEDADPDGILRGVVYPHGLRFSADGRHLFLADAGAPFVHIYASDDDGWSGVRYPAASVRIMDDATFQRGPSPEDRGAKGLAVDKGGHVLVVTSEYQLLEFFELDALMCAASSEEMARARRRQEVCRELDLLANQRDMAMLEPVLDMEKIVEMAATLDYVLASRSWKITAPLRSFDAFLRGADRRDD